MGGGDGRPGDRVLWLAMSSCFVVLDVGSCREKIDGLLCFRKQNQRKIYCLLVRGGGRGLSTTVLGSVGWLYRELGACFPLAVLNLAIDAV